MRGRAAAAGLAVALFAALWDTGFHVVPAAEGTWRAVSDPPTVARLVLALLLGAGVALITRRWPADAVRPLFALALCALPLVPAATGHLLPLLALQGPVRVLLLAGVLSWTLVRLCRRSRAVSDPLAFAVPDVLLFATAFAFFLLLGTRLPGPAGPQGDEPQYLVMAQSLLSDGDLDLTDEVAHQEYARFYSGPFWPHRSLASPPDRTYSFHLPGLSVLVLPAYAWAGYPGTLWFLSALTALAAVLVHRLVRESLGDLALAAAAWAVFVFTPPVPFYALQLYPETPAVLAVAVFLLAARGRPTPGQVAAAAACAAVLPWLHTKFLPVGLLGLTFTLLRPCTTRARVAAAASFAASVALLLVFFHRLYGTASLSAAYGSPDWSLARLPWGLAGLFFDRQYGLFAVSPVWALALPGLVLLWRRRPGDTIRSVVLAGLPLAASAGFVAWWGGACPPGRFVLVSLPALVLALALAMKARPDLAAALAGVGLGVVGLAAEAPRILHNRFDGESLLLRYLSPAVDVNALLPSFFETTAAVALLAVTLLAVLALAWRWGLRGLFAGAIAFVLVADAMSDRALIDERIAGQDVLFDWQPGRWRALAGAPDLRALALPFELPRRPWVVEGPEPRNSRMMDLPPGRYLVEVALEPLERTPPSAVRLEVHALTLPLASAVADDGRSSVTLPLTLPVGARHLSLTAIGLRGRTALTDARLRPQVVVPREARAGLLWPVFAEPERYRIPTGPVSVTVLDRSVPEGSGFRAEGDEAAFVLDGRSGTPLDVRIVRARPGSADVLLWGGRPVALGAESEARLSLSLDGGTDLGPTTAMPVVLRAPGAWIGFGP